MIVIVWAFFSVFFIFLARKIGRAFSEREEGTNSFIEFNFTSTCSIKFHLNYLEASLLPFSSLYTHTHTQTFYIKHFMFSNELNMYVVLIRSSTTFLTDLQTFFIFSEKPSINTNRHLDIFHSAFPCFSTFWINFKISLLFFIIIILASFIYAIIIKKKKVL